MIAARSLIFGILASWACSQSTEEADIKAGLIHYPHAPITPRWDNGRASAPVVIKGNKAAGTQGMDLRWSLTAPPLRNLEERHTKSEISLMGRIAGDKSPWMEFGKLVKKQEVSKGPWSGMLKTCRDVCPFEEGLLGTSSKTVGQLNMGDLAFQDRLVMLFTQADFSGLGGPIEDIPQTIVMGFLDETNTFKQYEKPLLSPIDFDVEKLGYSTKPSTHIVQAWRDPFLFEDNEGKYHMVFGARFNANSKPAGLEKFDPNRNSAVGHAIFDKKSNSFKLQKPLPIAQEAAQFELPHVLKYKGQYYLIILEADWQINPDNTTTERIHRLRMYKTPSLTAPAEKWQNWGKMENGQRSSELVVLNGKDYNIYGITFSQEGDGFKVMGFDNEKFNLTEEITFKNADLDDPNFSQQLGQQFQKVGRAEIGQCQL